MFSYSAALFTNARFVFMDIKCLYSTDGHKDKYRKTGVSTLLPDSLNVEVLLHTYNVWSSVEEFTGGNYL